MTLDKLLFVAGLVFDIMGAHFLARGIAQKPLRSMADESRVGFGGPPNLDYVAGVLEQRIDAQIGFWLLALGFGIQSLDYLILDSPPSWRLPRWSVGLGILALGWSLHRLGNMIRCRLFRQHGPHLLAYVIKSITDNGRRKDGTDDYICSAAKMLTPWFGRNADEDEKAFARRVWAMIDRAHQAGN